MDPSTDVLAETVRAKRDAIDNDLELLRLRARRVQPKRIAAEWGRTALPVVAGVATVWLWTRRRRSVRSLQDLLVRTLSDVYAAEHQLLPALGRMSRSASNPDLVSLFTRHSEESRTHVDRLERVLRSVGAKPRRGESATVAALELEDRRLRRRKVAPDVRDAWLIATAQRMEHLEIANYGTARTFAETLGYTYAARLLQQTLEEERAMDEQLTRLAERFVNPEAIR